MTPGHKKMPRGRKTVTPGHEKVTPRHKKVTPRAQKGAPGGAGLIPSVWLYFWGLISFWILMGVTLFTAVCFHFVIFEGQFT